VAGVHAAMKATSMYVGGAANRLRQRDVPWSRSVALAPLGPGTLLALGGLARLGRNGRRNAAVTVVWHDWVES
jgi:hypothetical protein